MTILILAAVHWAAIGEFALGLGTLTIAATAGALAYKRWFVERDDKARKREPVCDFDINVARHARGEAHFLLVDLSLVNRSETRIHLFSELDPPAVRVYAHNVAQLAARQGSDPVEWDHTFADHEPIRTVRFELTDLFDPGETVRQAVPIPLPAPDGDVVAYSIVAEVTVVNEEQFRRREDTGRGPPGSYGFEVPVVVPITPRADQLTPAVGEGASTRVAPGPAVTTLADESSSGS